MASVNIIVSGRADVANFNGNGSSESMVDLYRKVDAISEQLTFLINSLQSGRRDEEVNLSNPHMTSRELNDFAQWFLNRLPEQKVGAGDDSDGDYEQDDD